MTDKSEKSRISVTVTKSYVDGLSRLVDEGVYLNRGDAILEGIRIILRIYKVEPFSKLPEPEESEE